MAQRISRWLQKTPKEERKHLVSFLRSWKLFILIDLLVNQIFFTALNWMTFSWQDCWRHTIVLRPEYYEMVLFPSFKMQRVAILSKSDVCSVIFSLVSLVKTFHQNVLTYRSCYVLWVFCWSNRSCRGLSSDSGTDWTKSGPALTFHQITRQIELHSDTRGVTEAVSTRCRGTCNVSAPEVMPGCCSCVVVWLQLVGS